MSADIIGKVEVALSDSREKGLAVANAALKAASNKNDEAIALLAVSKAVGYQAERGSKASESALNSARRALTLFKSNGDKNGEALAYVEIAGLESITEKAVQAAKTAMLLFSGLKDKKGESSAAHALLDAQMAHAGPEAGLSSSQRALELAREVGNKKNESAVLQSVLGLHIKASDADKAMKVASEALKLAQETKDNDSYMSTLSKVLLMYSTLQNPAEARQAAENALQVFIESGDKAGQAGTLSLLTNTLLDMGEWSQAMESATKAFELSREINDAKGVLVALRALLMVHASDRSKQRVLAQKDMVDVASAGVEFFEKSGDKLWLSQALRTQAVVLFETGQPRQAMRVLSSARELHKELGDKEGEETILNIIVSAFLSQNEPAVALKAAGELFALYLSLADQPGQVEALLISANIQLQQKDVDKALEVAKDALGIAKESGDRKLELRVMSTVQSLYIARKDKDDRAIDIAQEIIGIARDIGDVVQEASALFTLSKLVAQKVSAAQKPGENYSSAISQCQDAIELLQDVDNKRAQLPILEFIYSMQRAQGEALEAMDAARDIVAIMQDLGKPNGEAGALIMVAEADSSTLEALQSAEEAFQIFQALGDTFGQAVAMHLLFKAHFAQDDLDKAFEAATKAKVLFQEAGDTHGQAVCSNAAANVLLRRAHSSKTEGESVTKLCVEATTLAREALESFASIGDAHGRSLSMNIIKDMTKVNGIKGVQEPVDEESEEPKPKKDNDLDCLGLPLIDPWDPANQKPKREKPRKLDQPAHSTLEIMYTPWYPKGAPTPSEEHRHLLVVGQYPKLFRSILKARPGIAKEAMKKVQQGRGTKPPRGIVTPMRLVSEVALSKAVQDSACTGVVLNFADHERVSNFDVIDVSLRMIRAAQAMSDSADPVSLEFLTSGQNHAAPDALPELRHPLHGTLIGVVRAANQEYAGAEIRLLDIEPPHKRTPVPQIFYRGVQRPYAEAIVRRGIVYIPKIVGSGATPHQPMQFELIQGSFKEKAWEDCVH